MSKVYEMCNDVDSKEILAKKEQMTLEERKRLLESMKREGVISEKGKRNHRGKIGKTVGWAAAAAVLLVVIIPNVSAEAAYAMEQIPILGSVIKAVTIREYQYESENLSADIQKVQLEQSGGTENLKTQETITTINETIEEMTNRLIERFEEQVEAGEDHRGIYVDHEVVTDTDTWFTLRMNVTEVAGSGAQYQYYYHIDKTTGEIASLKNLFQEGADFVTPISENIKEQMREAMAEDEMKIYWIDSEEDMGFQFEAIKEEQNFYLNDKGQIVICFDEYEVAPGYMGLVEFTVDEEAVAGILK